jgi:glyoxylase-like metal-dependent hydrolase (beta-lactamase superfamily II)
VKEENMRMKTFQLGALGTNCYLVWDEETKDAFIVDPADYTAEVESAIKEEGLRLKYVVLTHGHGDHIGGVRGVQKAFPEAQLAVGKDELTVLGDPALNYSEYTNGRIETFVPDLMLSDGDEIMVGGLALKIIETPGHTIGGISIFIEADGGGTLFSGDTLFLTSIGRTDLPTGDFAVLERSIQQKLYTLPDETEVYPGHMGPTTIGYEKRYNGIVRAI